MLPSLAFLRCVGVRSTTLLGLSILAGTAACSETPTATSAAVVPDHGSLTTVGVSALTVTPGTAQLDPTVVGIYFAGVPYKVTNSGSTALALYTLRSSGDTYDFNEVGDGTPRCQYGTNAPKLAPGESCGATINFTPADTGKRSAAWAFIDANGDSVKLQLSGVGLSSSAPAIATSGSTDFGPQRVGVTSAARKVSITNTGNAAVALFQTTVAGTAATFFAIVNAGSSSLCADIGWLAAGASCDIFVTFRPSIEGSFGAWLSVRTDAGAVATSLSGTGVTSAAAVSASPSSVNFLSQVVGATSTAQKVTILNSGTDDLILSSLSVVGAQAKEFKISPYTNIPCVLSNRIAPGASCEVPIQFTPLAVGTRVASLDLQSNGGNASVALSGNAIQPVPILSVPTTALSFAPLDVFTASSAQEVVVKNVGTGPLTLTSLALNGSNAADFLIGVMANVSPNTNGPCVSPMPIAPGASCIAQITFVPKATGPRTATLTIETDAGAATVALSGTGTLPPTDVSVSVGATPTTANAGKPLTYTITVRNNGSAVAQGVRVTDVVPATTTFASISGTPEFVCSTPAVGGTGTVSCVASGAMAPGAVRTISLVVKVLSGGRASVSNTVNVSADSPDPVFSNNSATVATTVYGRK